MLRRDAELGRERKVGWLELFFDLVFVVLIAQMAHQLEEHASLAGIATFALVLFPVWWLWMGTVVYSERYEADDLRFRSIVLVQMLAVAALAVTLSGHGSAPAFSVAYVVARGITVAAWWRAGHFNRDIQPLVTLETAGYTIALAMWLASAFTDGALALSLRIVGLLLDLTTPAIVHALTSVRLPAISGGRIAERFGLFTILVLGESIARAIAGVEDPTDPVVMGALMAGVLLTFSVWALYFDHIAGRKPQLDGGAGFLWAYGHMPLFGGAIAAAAMMAAMISGGGDGTVQSWVFTGGIALTLAALAGIGLLLPASADRRGRLPFTPLALAAAALILCLTVLPMSSAALLASSAGVLALTALSTSPRLRLARAD